MLRPGPRRESETSRCTEPWSAPAMTATSSPSLNGLLTGWNVHCSFWITPEFVTSDAFRVAHAVQPVERSLRYEATALMSLSP